MLEAKLRLIEAAGREGRLGVYFELATTGYCDHHGLVPESPRGPTFKCSLPLPKNIIPGLCGLRTILHNPDRDQGRVSWLAFSTLWW